LDGFAVVASARGTVLADLPRAKNTGGPDECLVGWAQARGLAVWVDRNHSGKLGERPGAWGNPHNVDRSDPRPAAVKHKEACDLYAADIAARPDLHPRIVAEHRGKVLLCWCRPKPCHADALAISANADQGLT